MGIEILPPDVNEGESFFSVRGNSIVFALNALKSVGTVSYTHLTLPTT